MAISLLHFFFSLPITYSVVAHPTQSVGFNLVLHFHPVYWLVRGQLGFACSLLLFPLSNAAGLPSSFVLFLSLMSLRFRHDM